MRTARAVDGVLFDKDGTLFDFSATWDVWADGLLRDLSQGDAARLYALAAAAGYDLENRRFHRHSRVIAGTNREAAECLAPVLEGWTLEEIEARGEPFDPNLHEAMMEVADSEHPPGTVLEEMEKGYMLRDKVVLPARVVVSKAGEAQPQDGEGEED